jgi:hypothetical protein
MAEFVETLILALENPVSKLFVGSRVLSRRERVMGSGLRSNSFSFS